MDSITVRRMPFEFPDEIDPVFIENNHEMSFSFISASLLLPYLEPYLIRSMRAARDQVKDPAVLEGLKKFSAQEGQHYRMHAKFNKAIKLGGFPRIEEFERELESDYKRFSETKSLRFNLAYAEGFEALTMNLIRFIMENPGFDNPESTIWQMWEWHFVEELEHRTVTFDVYDHVCGGYWYRLAAGIYAQWHFTRWIRRVTKYMLEVSPQPRQDADASREAQANGMEWGLSRPLSLLPSLLRIYLPNYSPHSIELSPAMQDIADRYSAMATNTS